MISRQSRLSCTITPNPAGLPIQFYSQHHHHTPGSLPHAQIRHQGPSLRHRTLLAQSQLIQLHSTEASTRTDSPINCYSDLDDSPHGQRTQYHQFRIVWALVREVWTWVAGFSRYGLAATELSGVQTRYVYSQCLSHAPSLKAHCPR